MSLILILDRDKSRDRAFKTGLIKRSRLKTCSRGYRSYFKSVSYARRL